MDTAIQKSYYRFLEGFIKEHRSRLLTSRVFIFGAGVRGCNLLSALRLFQIPDVMFVDNNPIKHGSTVEGCPVQSFPEAIGYTGEHIFLCPIENGAGILKQLEQAGRCENIDFFNLDFKLLDYMEVIEEIKRPERNYPLVFGCCVLSSPILGDNLTPSLGETLKQRVFSGGCKLCALPGFYPAMYYHIINAQLKLNGGLPGLVFIMMEVSSCSPYAPLMMGENNYLQHSLFVDELLKLVGQDRELSEYQNVIEQRLMRSAAGGNPVRSDNSASTRRRVYKLKYNYNIREDDESVIYTKKLISLLNEKGVPVILCFPPIDYVLAKTVCGEDFCDKYSAIISGMQLFLTGLSYLCVDASFIALSDCFVQQKNSSDINPFLNEQGQKRLTEFLLEQEALRPFLEGNHQRERER